MIREKHFKDLGNIRPISVCSNPNCERPIYKGDVVWKKGNDLYCRIQCLAKHMKKEGANCQSK